jgi:hypothetical protein
MFDGCGMQDGTGAEPPTIALVLWNRAQSAVGGAVAVFRGGLLPPYELLSAWRVIGPLSCDEWYPFSAPGEDTDGIAVAFVPAGAGTLVEPGVATRLALDNVVSATIVLAEAADGALGFTLADVVVGAPAT